MKGRLDQLDVGEGGGDKGFAAMLPNAEAESAQGGVLRLACTAACCNPMRRPQAGRR